MTDKKISELTNITGANLADADEFVVVDSSASETKAITWAELKEGLDTGTGFVRITGDTMTGDLSFGDDDKAIFGAGSDLEIYHSGSNSHITEAGTGNLIIRADDFRVQSNAGEEYIAADANGAVSLRYDNAQKLATTATGVDVTGTVTADGLTVDANSGNIELQWATGSTHKVGSSYSTTYFTGMRVTESSRNTDIISLDASGTGNINLFTGSTEIKRLSVNPSGDITFYDTSGNASFVYDESAGSVFNEQGDNKDFRVESDTNTHALFVDASANAVGFGTTSSLVNDAANEGLYYLLGGSLTLASNTESLQINRNGTGGNNRINIGLYNNGTKRGEIGTYGAEDGMYFYAGSTVDSLRLTSGEAVFNEGGADINFRVESDTYTKALYIDGSTGNVSINSGEAFSVEDGALNVNSRNESSPWGNFNISHYGNGYNAGFESSIYMGLRRRDMLNNNQVMGYRTTVETPDAGGASYVISSASSSLTTGTDGPNTVVERFRFSPSVAVFNEPGNNYDFRVESDSNDHMLFVDAGNDKVLVGTNTAVGNASYASALTVANQQATVGATLFPLASFRNATGFSDGLTIAAQDNYAFIDADHFSTVAGSGTGLIIRTNSTTTAHSMTQQVKLDAAGVAFNDDSNDLDFRVESNSQSHALYVDAGLNQLRFTVDGGYATYVESNGDGTRYVTRNTAHSIGFSSGSTYATGSEYAFIKLTGGASSTVDVVSDSGGVSLTNAATSWSSLSDSRLKTVTGTFDNAIADVKTLEPVRFTWNHDASNRTNVGLLAQSVQAVLPEAVNSGKHFEEDETEYLSVRYTEVIPLLTAALQEAITKIETLEARIAALEAK